MIDEAKGTRQDVGREGKFIGAGHLVGIWPGITRGGVDGSTFLKMEPVVAEILSISLLSRADFKWYGESDSRFWQLRDVPAI
jgi:hypothetical protein